MKYAVGLLLFLCCTVPIGAQPAAEDDMDRDAWAKAFIRGLAAVADGRDAVNDPGLVALVCRHTRHAIPQAVDWLDASGGGGESARARLERARLIGRILKIKDDADGLIRVVERVRRWGEVEWEAYRAAKESFASGDAAHDKGQWKSARASLLAAARGFRHLGRDARLAKTLQVAGICLFRLGRFREGMVLWEQALVLRESLGDTCGVAGVLNNLAVGYETLGQARKALALHERALGYVARTGALEERDALLNNIGSAYQALGEPTKAIDYYRRSLALREKMGNELEIADSLHNLGIAYCDASDERAALECGEKAVGIYRKLKRPKKLAMALNGVGNVHFRADRFSKAVGIFREALAVAKAADDASGTADALAFLGTALCGIRRHGEAERCFRAAIRLREGAGPPSNLAPVLAHLGSLCTESYRSKEALVYLRRALAIYRKLADRSGITVTLSSYGQACSALGRHEEAIRFLERSLEMSRDLGNDLLQVLILKRLAEALVAQGRMERALESEKKALALCRRMGRAKDEAAVLNNSGRICRLLGRYDDAIGLHRRALAIYRRLGDEWGVGVALNRLGSVHEARDEREEALKFHRQALTLMRKHGRSEDVASVLSHLGILHREQGDHEKAVGYFEEAMAKSAEAGDGQSRAVSLVGVTPCYAALGETEKAIACGKEAVKVLEQFGVRREISAAHTSLGVAYSAQGRFEESLASHRRALTCKEDDRDAAVSYSNIGVLQNDLGRFEEAIRCHERALALWEKAHDRSGVAIALSNLGMVYSSLGHLDKAIDFYERSLAIKRQLGRGGEIASSNNLANAWRRLSRFEKAAELHREALETAERARIPAFVAAALSGLAADCYMLGRFDEARRHYARAANLYATLGNEPGIARALVNLGSVLQRLSRLDDAEASYRRALAICERAGNDSRRAHVLYNLGRLLLAQGRLSSARRCFARAVECLSQSRSRLSADTERVFFMERRQPWLNPGLEAALRGDQPDSALALRIFESLRGASTADLFQASFAGVRPREHGEVRAEVRRVERQIDAIELRVRAVGGQTVSASKRRTELRAEQRTLESKWQDLHSRLARLSPRLANLQRPTPVSLASLRRALPPGAAYLAIVLGTRPILLLVDRDGLRHWSLPAAETIRQAVATHLDRLAKEPTASGDGAVIESGRRLYALLLAPAAEALAEVRTLIVAPLGRLNGLPLETLVLPASEDGKTPRFLLERHAFVYTHSATVWDIQRSHASQRAADRRRSNRILVLGDPVSPGEAEERRGALFATERGGALGRLPYTRAEAVSVLKRLVPEGDGSWTMTVDGKPAKGHELAVLLGEAMRVGVRDVAVTGPAGELRLGAAASRSGLLAAPLDEYRFLHIAAHGVLNEHNPALSGLVLSPGKDDSGYLRLMDIMNLRLGVQIATLSGCETAIGRATVGEGFQGLVRAFLFAGAENVVAAAWRVPDRSTAALLPAFYHDLLAGGVAPAEALQRAKLGYLKRVRGEDPRRAHPYYWGAWMLWGVGVRPAD